MGGSQGRDTHREQGWGRVTCNKVVNMIFWGKVDLHFEIVFLTFLVLKLSFFSKTIIVGGS